MEMAPVNGFEEVEKAAVAHEAREGLGRPHPHTSRAKDVEAALMRYLATEEYRESAASSHAADGDEGRSDSEESS